jgi:pyruvate formate lyase activating enzyme
VSTQSSPPTASLQVTGSALSATILHLQRLSTEDGPGLRTTVFFKGCPLRCAWCHNPESLSPQPQLQWLENRCIGDQACVRACTQSALTLTATGIAIDRRRCDMCGACTQGCPTNALELLGTNVTLDKLLHELLKDRAFFDASGGGVTLSGGEPTLQFEFAAALLDALKDAGVSTALDTCGACPASAWDRLLPHTDLVLYDLKEMDSQRHRQHTGQGNEHIVANLLRVRDWMATHPGHVRLWIRTPLIPRATAVQDNLQAIGAFLAQELSDAVERWELCAFNNLCRDKYRRLGMAWEYADTPLLSSDELTQAERWARQSGFESKRVTATGSTAAAKDKQG